MSRTPEQGEHLENDAFCGELAGRLEVRRSALLDQALAEVCGNAEVPRAQALSAPQLRDHLPKLLDRLVAHLRGAPRERVRRFFEDAVAASAERFVEDAGRVKEDAEKRLREADASRLNLLGAVTHDLRGFLQALTWAIERVGADADADRQRLRNAGA